MINIKCNKLNNIDKARINKFVVAQIWNITNS